MHQKVLLPENLKGRENFGNCRTKDGNFEWTFRNYEGVLKY